MTARSEAQLLQKVEAVWQRAFFFLSHRETYF